MKRILSGIFLLLLLVVIGTGCKKFLERPPEGQMTEEEAIKNEADVLSFANGQYTLIANNEFLGGRIQSLSDMLADELDGSRFTGDFSEIFKRQNSIFGATRDNLYKNGYRIINVSNILIRKLSLVSDGNKNQVRGQALFCRALAHFELVRLFAQPWGYSPDNSHNGIPLRTEIVIGSIQRSTVKQVYDQVIADLKEAETLLGDGKYVASKWAAKAYLAKVYFQMNDFANAYTYASQVVANNTFVLDDTYAKRFSPGLSKEGIFVILNEVNRYSPGGELRGNYRSDLAIPVLNYTSQFYTTANSDPADVRKAAWYSNTLHSGYFVTTKYNRDFFDLPIVHLTEMKLILAESGAEIASSNAAALTAAITNLNSILTRAYGGTSRNLAANATAGLVISTSRKERELEMVAEGNRYHEIKRIGARNNTNVDRRGSPWNCPGFILQFPKAEQDAFTAFILNPEGGCF